MAIRKRPALDRDGEAKGRQVARPLAGPNVESVKQALDEGKPEKSASGNSLPAAKTRVRKSPNRSQKSAEKGPRAFIRAGASLPETENGDILETSSRAGEKKAEESGERPGSNILNPHGEQVAALLDVESRNTILSHVSIAVSFGIVPVPLFDFVAVGGTQLHMIRELASLHGVPFDDELGRSLVTGLAGGALPLLAGAGVASFAKFIPGTGSLVGGAALAVSAGALTWAIGTLFARHFRRGGRLEDFDRKAGRKAMRELMREGREISLDRIARKK